MYCCLGFGTDVEQVRNRCNGEFYTCAKQQMKPTCYLKVTKGVTSHKESLIQITFFNTQNSPKLHHEVIIISLTLHS
jgi:hypothetical protein